MSAVSEETVKHVTVVGGGFTGAIFTHHLLQESRLPLIVDIVEERACLGAGVAYSAAEPHQTTNVPVGRMSVYAEDRAHFERWLANRSERDRCGAKVYPNRSWFGVYMDELVRSTVPANPRSRLRHLRARVQAVQRTTGDLVIRTSDGQSWRTDVVALATGNPSPTAPGPVAPLSTDPRVIVDPWAPQALAHVQPDDRVLMLGAGLTMGELVAGLRASGHRGKIVAISRRGRRPERGVIDSPAPFGDFVNRRPATAVQLLRRFRAEVRRAEAAGLSWRPVAAAVRTEGWAVWAALPIAERRRFVRHLRPFWEALRHVMPGPVHDMLEAERRRGGLHVFAASLETVDPCDEGLNVTFRPRSAAPADCVREQFDVVVNCTGAAYATLTKTNPFWVELAQAGLVVQDTVGFGIEVDRCGRALDAGRTAQPDVLVLGTLARGAFGELTGVPELSRQTREAARALAETLSADQNRDAVSAPYRKAV